MHLVGLLLRWEEENLLVYYLCSIIIIHQSAKAIKLIKLIKAIKFLVSCYMMTQYTRSPIHFSCKKRSYSCTYYKSTMCNKGAI